MNDAVHTRKQTSYWLIVRDTENGVETYTTDLGASDSGRMLPVFSFEEEAEMYLFLRGSRGDWRISEALAGDLHRLFDTILENIVCVTLDPIPENSFFDTTGLLSITRQDFIVRLQSANRRLRLA